MDETIELPKEKAMFKYVLVLVFICFSSINAQNCDDILGFVDNPQYTGGANQDECYPEDFVYYTSIAQGFYLFLEVFVKDY